LAEVLEFTGIFERGFRIVYGAGPNRYKQAIGILTGNGADLSAALDDGPICLV